MVSRNDFYFITLGIGIRLRPLQHALRNSVRKSLQQLSKAINGDAKMEPQNFFKASGHGE